MKCDKYDLNQSKAGAWGDNNKEEEIKLARSKYFI